MKKTKAKNYNDPKILIEILTNHKPEYPIEYNGKYSFCWLLDFKTTQEILAVMHYTINDPTVEINDFNGDAFISIGRFYEQVKDAWVDPDNGLVCCQIKCSGIDAMGLLLLCLLILTDRIAENDIQLVSDKEALEKFISWFFFQLEPEREFVGLEHVFEEA